MTNHKIVKIFLILTLFSCGCIFEKGRVRYPKETILNMPIEEFKAKNETIDEVFKELNIRHYMARILVEFCTEDEPYYKNYKNKIPAKPINIDFKNTTVGEVIKEALRQDPRYAITEIDGYFVITQRELIDAKGYIFNKKIKYKYMEEVISFQVDWIIMGWFKQNGIDMVFRNLAISGSPYLINLDLTNKTLREVLIDLGKFYYSSIFVQVSKDKVYYLFYGDSFIKGVGYLPREHGTILTAPSYDSVKLKLEKK